MTDQQWARSASDPFERMIRAMIGCPVPIHRRGEWCGVCGRDRKKAVFRLHLHHRDNARFALTEVTLGVTVRQRRAMPPRAVGARRAKEILLTGRPFSVQEAYQWGMVNRVYAPPNLLPSGTGGCPR